MWRSMHIAWMIFVRIFIELPILARHGLRLRMGCHPTVISTWCEKIRKKKGLLYAGTETGIYVSFDDGDHWQSLQLNLPTVPVYDLAIHENDLTVATHGRAFWILDDLSPLR